MKDAKLRCGTRVILATEEKFFGPGVAQLMELIRDNGSMAEACRLMEMSYSKGWKIIKRAEEALKCPLVNATRGGKGGGRMTLTAEGEELLHRYTELSREVNEAAQQLFLQYFGSQSD